MHRIERIRAAIPCLRQPFDTHAVAKMITKRTQHHGQTVRNGLIWLLSHGELERHYVKKGRRARAVVFTTTAEFGQRKTSPEQILAAMKRLDRALRRWKRDIAEIRP